MSSQTGASSNMHLVAVPSIEMNTDYSSAVRFPAWVALALFSTVCLVATTTEISSKDRGAEEKFVIAVESISLALSFLAVLGYLLVRGIFKSTVIELAMIGVVAAFWGVGLFYIMAPDNMIAVTGTTVTNANLYFFSWVCLGLVVFLLMSYMQESIGVDPLQTPGKQARWFFFFASSLVVMGVASRIHSSVTGCAGNENDAKFCKRTAYAISVGVISAAAALLMTFMAAKGISSPMIDLGVTVVLLAMWTFAVGFITFGNGANSPGTRIGNLYFSTWASFCLCVMLFGHSFQEFAGMHSSTPQTTNEPSNEEHSNDNAATLPNEEDF